tara:strand:- start:80 stop:310 length:231 start_codon:yes stop_codon:yes gene_type:complete
MENQSLTQSGSYIVRDKKGTYMGAYSEKLGKSKAVDWATECAKRSKGILYHRDAPGNEEQEIARFLDFGKKSKSRK